MDTSLLVFVTGSVAVLFGLYVAARRAVTIAELQIQQGTLRVVRGGLPPSVLADLRDVASKPPIVALRVRIHRSNGRAAIELDGPSGGVSPEQAQRIRNVVGNVPLARLMSGRRR
jgi:hypothetical protein